jgi:hypothetical protein
LKITQEIEPNTKPTLPEADSGASEAEKPKAEESSEKTEG